MVNTNKFKLMTYYLHNSRQSAFQSSLSLVTKFVSEQGSIVLFSKILRNIVRPTTLKPTVRGWMGDYQQKITEDII